MSLMLPIYFVDAFTTNGNSAFTGNAAAVCILEYDDEISDELKQKIASEVNLSETAFVSFGWSSGEKLGASAEGSHIHRRTIRWFTPTTEVVLCGHATVASTKALLQAQFTELNSDPNVKTITFSFDSKFRGELGAVYSKDTERITLNFPSNPTHKAEQTPWMDFLVEASLGDQVSRKLVCDLQISPIVPCLVIRLAPENGQSPVELIRKVSANPREIAKIATSTGGIVRDVIVTVQGEAGPNDEAGLKEDGNGRKLPHFYSRYFAPLVGIDEDPVTGLGHTVLTPYWTQELNKLKGSGTVGTILGNQHSTRGGNVYCTLVGNRVSLAGEAKVTIKGNLFYLRNLI